MDSPLPRRALWRLQGQLQGNGPSVLDSIRALNMAIGHACPPAYAVRSPRTSAGLPPPSYPTTEKLLSRLISRFREQNDMSSVKSMFGNGYWNGLASWSLPLVT